MDEFDKWSLPVGINEVLPEEARYLEGLRARTLRLFDSWGYDLVIPPLVEYLEAFLLDDKDDLQVQTFKLTDQIDGRMLGMRPDMTPQIARIDAHPLRGSAVNRLCYVGRTLTTRPQGSNKSRSPMQIGAEMYGVGGAAGDTEILLLMLELFDELEVRDVHLVLGHIGIYATLADLAGLNKNQSKFLAKLMRNKAKADMQDYMQSVGTDADWIAKILDLVDCYGDISIISAQKEKFSSVDSKIVDAFDEIERVAGSIADKATIHCDLLGAPGYDYEDGLTFSAYASGLGQEIARGGRYDGIGQIFGRSRPAVGFSSDLELIAQVSNLARTTTSRSIFAPQSDDPKLKSAITEARKAGDRVIIQLGKEDVATNYGCTHTFVEEKGTWSIRGLDE